MNSPSSGSRWTIIVLLAVVATLAGTAEAATTGQLSGLVVDDDGNPLPGVTVTASSPTQIGGVRSTETDLQGWFQYPRLNPGFFTVRLILDGFLTQELTEVQVRLDRMTQVHVTMPLATFGEGVTVTETTPVVDPQRVSTGQTFTNDYLQAVSIGMGDRAFPWMVVLNAAGTTQQGGWGGVSVLGSTNQENQYQIDGLDVTNPYWGGAASWIPVDSIQEVGFESGGFAAEYGRATGGVVNLLTKSGSNNLHGSFDVRYWSDFFEPSEEDPEPWEGFSDRIVTATLGGRFVRDRAWFFGSLDYQLNEHATGPETTFEDEWLQGFLKVTGQVTPNWLALGKYNRFPWEISNFDSNEDTGSQAAGRQDGEIRILQVEASGVLSQSLLWELQIGSQVVEQILGPMSGDPSAIRHYNYDTDETTGNYLLLWSDSTQRVQFGTDLTWFVDDALGSHTVKLGGDLNRTSREQNNCWTGIQNGDTCQPGEAGYLFQDFFYEGQSIPFYMRVFSPPGPFELTGVLPSVFVQDSWRVRPDLTLQLGLRWDRSIYEDGAGNEVADLEMLQPRLGATWDLTRNGRNLLRASWGRFIYSSALRLPRFSTALPQSFEFWWACSLPTDYDGLELSDPGECAAVADSWGIPYRTDPEAWDPGGWLLDFDFGGSTDVIDPSLRPQYAETVIVGFERELFRRTSLELSFVDKATRDIHEDTCIGNYPTPNPDADCSSFIIANLPQARRDYRAWMLNFESRAIDRLHVLASYTYSDTKGSTASNRAEIDFDQYPYHYENTYGYLEWHRQHQVKISGFTLLPWDFGLGFRGFWGSPRRWAPLIPSYLAGDGVYHRVFAEPRGSREDNGEYEAQVDLQVTKGFNVGRGVRLQLIGSIFNLFDTQNITEVCVWVNGCGDEELGEPIGWQQARGYELGVRVEF